MPTEAENASPSERSLLPKGAASHTSYYASEAGSSPAERKKQWANYVPTKMPEGSPYTPPGGSCAEASDHSRAAPSEDRDDTSSPDLFGESEGSDSSSDETQADCVAMEVTQRHPRNNEAVKASQDEELGAEGRSEEEDDDDEDDQWASVWDGIGDVPHANASLPAARTRGCVPSGSEETASENGEQVEEEIPKEMQESFFCDGRAGEL